MTHGITITLPNGKTARVTKTEGDHTTIESPEPSPPGSTVRGRIQGIKCEFELKVRNCKKVGDSFFIDGRARNATREMKEYLKALEAPDA